MSGYTPTTEQIQDNYVEGMNAFYGERGASEYADQFRRWLTAHDAEVRAGVVAKEPEWEYGVGAESSDRPGSYWIEEKARNREQAEAWMSEYAEVGSFANAVMLRRRKAGPWEPVEN